MQSKAVLFDVDGVVVDSERYWVELEGELYPSVVESPEELRAILFGEG